MRAVIMADRGVATREREMLARLEVGLADEGVRVVHAAPQDVLEQSARTGGGGIGLGSRTGWSGGGGGELADAGLGLFSTPIGWEASGWSFGRAARVERLRESISQSLEDSGDDRIDIVHAFGSGCWAEARDLAAMSGAKLILELCESACIGRASGLALSKASLGSAPTFIAGEEAVRGALLKRAPGATVFLVPWGVHAPPTPRELGRPERVVGVAVLLDGADARSIGGVLAGIQDGFARCSRERPGLEPVLMVDAGGASSRRVAAAWAHARRLRMVDRLTLVPEMEARREPVLDLDMLVLASPSGRQRTIVLEAMATGMLVVARADPFLPSLADGVTARLVHDSTPTAWAETIVSAISDATAGAKLSASAHAFVKRERLAAFQVAGVLNAYERVLESGSAGSAPVVGSSSG